MRFSQSLQPYLRFAIALVTSLATNAHAAGVYGIVRSLDGQFWEGEIHLTNQAFQVAAPDGKEHIIGLDKFASFAPSPRPPQAAEETDTDEESFGLLGSYFESPGLNGPARSRLDGPVDFQWDDGPPMEGFRSNYFSVRWEGEIVVPTPGTHQFHAVSDDGVRLWVDGQLLVDYWGDRTVGETSGSIMLNEAKPYPVKVEYYEHAGQAVMRLLWTPPNGNKEPIPRDRLKPPPPSKDSPALTNDRREGPTGWLGMYFGTPDLKGTFRSVTNAQINFDWGHNAPLPGMKVDGFSVRWIGVLTVPEPDRYTFHVESDDGCRLWLDGKVVLDYWRDGVFNLNAGAFHLSDDRSHLLQLEIFDNNAAAKARLSWSSSKFSKALLSDRFVRPVAVPEDSAIALPGVLLVDGSFLALPVASFDSGLIRFVPPSAPALPLTQAARLHLQSIPQESVEALDPNRTGILLQNGDFLDGEARRLQDGRLTLNSVLLGLKSVRQDEVAAVVLREARERPAQFEIRTYQGSLIRVDQFELSNDEIRFTKSLLEGIRLPVQDIRRISRAGETVSDLGRP